MRSTDRPLEMCWKTTRAPVRRASAMSRATMASSEDGSAPGTPSAAAAREP